jgi:hypothetical protein
MHRGRTSQATKFITGKLLSGRKISGDGSRRIKIAGLSSIFEQQQINIRIDRFEGKQNQFSK